MRGTIPGLTGGGNAPKGEENVVVIPDGKADPG
jgi:hypothetical protein